MTRLVTRWLLVAALCCTTDAWAGRERPAPTAYFPAGNCTRAAIKPPLAADEYPLIRYSYKQSLETRYELVQPGSCLTIDKARFPTLKAACAIYRRERLQPDEPLRVSGEVSPSFVKELPPECKK